MSDFLFDKLPEWAKRRLSEDPGYKEWKKCTKCNTSHTTAKLRACAGCVKMLGAVGPVYYCSKTCQKNDWPRHKVLCQSSAPTSDREIALNPRPGQLDMNVGKWIARWRKINMMVIGWAIENIYYYNPHLDPHNTFVSFYLDRNTLQISYIIVERTEGFDSWRDLFQGPGVYNFTMCVPPNPPNATGTGDCVVTAHIDLGIGSTPEGRASVIGHPQWFSISVHLTRRLEASYTVARKKWNILRITVELNRRLGRLSLSPEFMSPPSFSLSEIVHASSDQMLRWYLSLMSIDFWDSVLVTASPETSECTLSKMLDHVDRTACDSSSDEDEGPNTGANDEAGLE